jgi:hypothetical protein
MGWFSIRCLKPAADLTSLPVISWAPWLQGVAAMGRQFVSLSLHDGMGV